MLRFIRRQLDAVGKRRVEEAEQLLRLTEEARAAGERPRPLGWTAWPPVSSGGATRGGATMRPPSASRWQ